MKICCEKKNNAKELIAKAFAGIEEKSYLDIHVHLVGNESKEGNQAWRRYFYRKAFKVKNLDQLEQDAYRYFESLVFKEGTYGLLAIDQVYDETGALQVKKTFFHVRNETIFKLAARNPHFFPIASIHPYRKDACDQLDMWAEQGIRTIKWLPNAMQIDPSHELCLPFYKKMAQKKMGLLCHVGKEWAVPGPKQAFGNPLLLKVALEQGVKVIMAHCGTLGKNQDIEAPHKKWVSNFELFLRMMKRNEYSGLLFGDLASVAQVNRSRYLPRLLELTQPGGLLYGRILQGSDYPLTNSGFIFSPMLLAYQGLLSLQEASILHHIFRFNPLLFEFVLKRTLRHPKTGAKFPPEIFMKSPNLIFFEAR